MKYSCEKLEPLPIHMHVLERLLLLIYIYMYVYFDSHPSLLLAFNSNPSLEELLFYSQWQGRWKAAATASGKAVHMQPLTHFALWLLLGTWRALDIRASPFSSAHCNNIWWRSPPSPPYFSPAFKKRTQIHKRVHGWVHITRFLKQGLAEAALTPSSSTKTKNWRNTVQHLVELRNEISFLQLHVLYRIV